MSYETYKIKYNNNKEMLDIYQTLVDASRDMGGKARYLFEGEHQKDLSLIEFSRNQVVVSEAADIPYIVLNMEKKQNESELVAGYLKHRGLNLEEVAD